jgi:hypothetical protein
VKKPTTPWRRALATEVPKEIVDANPPGTSFRHAWTGNAGPNGASTRVHTLKQSGYYEPKVPKELVNTTTGGYGQKDTRLLALSPERKQAREYMVQEKAEAHLTDDAKRRADKATAQGYLVKQDEIIEDGEG